MSSQKVLPLQTQIFRDAHLYPLVFVIASLLARRTCALPILETPNLSGGYPFTILCSMGRKILTFTSSATPPVGKRTTKEATRRKKIHLKVPNSPGLGLTVLLTLPNAHLTTSRRLLLPCLLPVGRLQTVSSVASEIYITFEMHAILVRPLSFCFFLW